MGFKVNKITVKPDSKGVEEIMKSDSVREDLLKQAKEIEQDLNSMNITDEKWEANIRVAGDRLLFDVTNNDPAVKYKELINPKVAEYINSKKKKG